MLTFFFTGVPNPDEQKRIAAEEKAGVERQRGKRQRKRKRSIPKVQFFFHGPKASGQCDQCHATAASATFRRTGKKRKGGIPRMGEGGMPGRLVAPLKELCVGCHVQKSYVRAVEEGLWVHGPIADGDCTACHSPHQSKNRYMLVKKPEEICIQCHKEEFIISKRLHQGERDCLSCHNAHLGKDRLLLKKDYDEVF